ncbi:MAG: methylated-DNA--[protein]-cysteine S-methyltransferase [Rikenellaceae bacterium]
MKFARYQTALGKIKIGYKDEHITLIAFTNSSDCLGEDSAPCKLTDLVAEQINHYLQGNLKTFDLPISIEGTEFQKRVWHALLDIPYGETRSYKEIATAIGDPKASRAVGMANNRNPLLLVIPCHRVIGANGSLTGYAGGLEIKRALLQLETEHTPKF